MPAAGCKGTTRRLQSMSLPGSPEAVIADYRSAYQSRVASLIVRREVFSGRAKFGGYGDGKEVAQVALARVFAEGDWRAGYYRDQTLMFATGMLTIRQFFAQLYACGVQISRHGNEVT